MSICILVSKTKITSPRQNTIGVFSSPEHAYESFRIRLQQNRAPYTGGVFRYADLDKFSFALNEIRPASGILIYQHELFDIFIVWNVLDKPLA